MDDDRIQAAYDESVGLAHQRSKNPPAVLYHYTDHAGLLGILIDKRIRLGRARCMNDSREIEHGLEIARSEIQRALHSTAGERQRKLLQEALAIVSADSENFWAQGLPLMDAHVACFCEPDGPDTPDTLLHWALYGRGGDGYALGVHLDPTRLGKVDLFRVEYQEDKQRAEMKQIVERFLREDDAHPNPKYVGAFCGYALIQSAASMKNHTFHQEKEWRVVVSYTQTPEEGGQQVPLKFLPGTGAIRSCFEVALAPKAVSAIVMGPKIQAALTAPVLRMLLKEQSYTDVEIVRAKVSLR